MNDIQQWAKALLEFPNLRFVVIDTTSLDRNADVIRFLTLDKQGDLDESLYISPGRYPGQLNTEWTGIQPYVMKGRHQIPAYWDEITDALTGQFVLAYGFDFIQERLDENAAHYGLQPIKLIGDCLMQTCPAYFKVNVPAMKLKDAAFCIGYVLPTRPTAEQRARAQLALLRAMAEGITSVQTARSNDDEGDLDSHPF